MRRNTSKRILACLLALALSCSPVVDAAGASQAGQLVLAVITQEQVVIEPTSVSYQQGDTIRTALKNSGHSFEGIDTGFVSAIDGTADNYTLFYDQGGYDLDAAADTVTVVCFTSYQDQYSPQYLNLLSVMAAYNDSPNGVQSYATAQNAYDAARKALYGATASQAETLAADLRQAMDDYEAYLSGKTVPVTLEITQGQERLNAVNATFTGEFGNVTTVEQDTTVGLIPGSYTFDIFDGNISHVRGSVTVTGAQTLTATLPDGIWIADVDLSTGSGNDWAAVERQGNTYYIPDYAIGNLFPYITPGEGVDTAACGVYLAGTEGAARRTWLSKQTALTKMFPPNSMEGNSVVLEARMTDGSFEQYQVYSMELVRVPTLSALEVTGDGTLLPLGFDPAVTSYNVTTVSDALTVSPTALCADTAVTVNGVRDSVVEVPATDGGEIAVEVSHANGQSTVYTLHITKVASVDVTLTHDAGVNLEVVNTAGAVIAPKRQSNDKTVFALVPGEAYTYVSTKNTWYHTTALFTASGGLTVPVPTPETGDWLSGLHVGPTKTVAFQSDKAFSPDCHAYTYQVGSNVTSFGVLATLADAAGDCAINGYYPDYRYWNDAYGLRTLNAVSGKFKSSTTFLGASGEGNEMRLEVSRESGGVTYYQDYFLTAQRLLQLNDLALSTEGQALVLKQDNAEETPKFDKETLAYKVAVGQTQSSVTLDVKLLSTGSGNDNAFTVTASCGANQETLDYSVLPVQEAQQITLPLDTSRKEETISIQISREAAISQIYTIRLEKLPPVETVFQVSPADAVVFLKDDLTGSRVWPDNAGKYILNTNGSYTYTVTAYGYVTQMASFAAGEANRAISVTLEKAPENTRKDIAQEGDWISFRGNSQNNAVTDAPVPVKAEEAVLTWANRIGEGMSGGGVGSPILVGDVLYTYANNSVMKVDKNTGEVLLSREMDHASSFSITPPAYGEGMIFVGLSNGSVQAFDAETLESLWLYADPLGGQPNCPITYKDGYLYTGFWNSEVKQANFVCISVTDEDTTQGKEPKQASWTYTDKGFYWAGAYVADNFLLVTTDDGDSGYIKGHGDIVSLNPRTGAVLDCQTASGVGDLRSTVCYDQDTDAYYFTSKGGDFYGIQVDANGTFRDGAMKRIPLSNGSNNASTPPMSTSTPVVYHGRAYVGVSGTAQFGAYSGHNISVIDLTAWQVAYSVPTQGYPQTSGLLTTAYEADTEYVYVYFLDNYTPGKLRVLRDKAGQTAPDHEYLTTETYTSGGQTHTVETCYVLFTPHGAQAQYAICSPIADAQGNLYFKNDSGYLMCVGSVITELTIEAEPETVVYEVGQTFDANGLRVMAKYANGVRADVTKDVSFSREPLTGEDTEFTLSYGLGEYEEMYQNRDGQTGVQYHIPTATLDLTIYEDHLWDEGAVTKAPTCVEPGEIIHCCTLCGETRTEEIPATGQHSWDEGTVTRVPTCMEAGEITHRCALCGETKTEPIPATGQHVWDEGTVTKPATGTEDGEITYTCVLCGAERVESIPATGVCDGGANCPSRAFTDLNPKEWYHEGVDYALNTGLMVGMSATTFQPMGTLTRGQVVTILYRLAGEPSVDGLANPFADVQPNAYYGKAVIWAANHGVVKGMSQTQFAPNRAVTREQTATFLYRYAVYAGMNTQAAADLSPYTDAGSISGWAREAMTWAVGTGLIQGMSKTQLAPKGTALRAQIATIIMRFSMISF